MGLVPVVRKRNHNEMKAHAPCARSALAAATRSFASRLRPLRPTSAAASAAATKEGDNKVVSSCASAFISSGLSNLAHTRWVHTRSVGHTMRAAFFGVPWLPAAPSAARRRHCAQH